MYYTCNIYAAHLLMYNQSLALNFIPCYFSQATNVLNVLNSYMYKCTPIWGVLRKPIKNILTLENMLLKPFGSYIHIC